MNRPNPRREWHLTRTPGGRLDRDSAKLVLRQIAAGPLLAGQRYPEGGLIHGYPCSRCGDACGWLPESLCDQPEGLCISCAAELRDQRAAESEARSESGSERQARFRGLLEQTGLFGQARILAALELGANKSGGQLRTTHHRGRRAATAVHQWLAAPSQGLLILSGLSGAGKSVAAGWAVWKTCGQYWARSRWSALLDHGEIPDETMRAFLATRAVVVLDNALDVGGTGDPKDSRAQIELVFRVATERHEAGLPTIITTQALENDFSRAFGGQGEALLRRASVADPSNGGGFVDCSHQVRMRV